MLPISLRNSAHDLVASPAIGAIIAAIWLVATHEWKVVALGLGILIFSTKVLRSAFVISTLIALPGAYFAPKGKTLGTVCFVILSSLYTNSFVTAWCCGLLVLLVKDTTSHALIPRLMWSYGIAIEPLEYIAVEDPHLEGELSPSQIPTFFAAMAYFVVMLLVISVPVSLLGITEVFAVFMLVSLVVQTRFALLAQRAESDAKAGGIYA